MKLHNKILFVLLPILCGFFQVFSQSEETENPFDNLTPPSPTAYELGKYGQVPVGMFTGTPNVRIPIYTYPSKSAEIPISLSYNSNGIKVDQMSGWTGLGWSLNAGGVITRIVKDQPDEYSNYLIPPSEIKGMNDPWSVDFFNQAAEGDHDTEKDLFMFNFLNYSGKFVFDENHKPLIMPYQPIQVEAYSNGAMSFKVTTPDGVRYFFEDREITRTYTGDAGFGVCPSSNGSNLPSAYVTSWYLSRIQYPTGEVLTFTYESENYVYDAGITQIIRKKINTYAQSNCGGAPSCTNSNNVATCKSISDISGKRLSSISSNLVPHIVSFQEKPSPMGDYPGLLLGEIIVDAGDLNLERIEFEYLLTSPAGRVFLDKVQFKDPNRNYQLEYIDPEDLPERLSLAQDHWGYFNNVNSLEFFCAEYR